MSISLETELAIEDALANYRDVAGTYIGCGDDSRVIRHGDYVVKVYDTLSMDEVIAYQGLTRGAIDLLTALPFSARFESDLGLLELRYSVNPILHVQANEADQVLAVSRYVPGPTANQAACNHPIWDTARIESDHPLMGLDPHAQALIRQERTLISEPDLKNSLDSLSAHMDRFLGCNGILVSSGNVKLVVNPESGIFGFTVTDIGAAIKRIDFARMRDTVSP